MTANDRPDGVVSAAALHIGRALARKVFAQRGNHSEAHLSEVELAALLAVAAETGAWRERQEHEQ